jgi:hypothetical protein
MALTSFFEEKLKRGFTRARGEFAHNRQYAGLAFNEAVRIIYVDF